MMRYFIAVLIFKMMVLNGQGQGLSVNTDASAPDQSAMLHVSSTTKGTLLTRMTATERSNIVLPATGLLVYQTDGLTGFYYNSGTAVAPIWQKMSADEPAISFTGNYNGAGQGFASGIYAKVQFNIEEYDESNNFVPGATSEFTAPSAGIYHFAAVVTITGSSNSRYDIALFVNGVQKKNNLAFTSAASGLITLAVNADFKLATSDRVDVRVYGSGVGGTVVGGSAPWNYFSGHKVK